MRDHTRKLEEITGINSRKNEKKSYSFKNIIKENLQVGQQRKIKPEAYREEMAGLLSSYEMEHMDDGPSMQQRKDSYDAGKPEDSGREVQQLPHEMISAAHEQEIRRPAQDIQYPVREPINIAERQHQERKESEKPEREKIQQRYEQYHKDLAKLHEESESTWKRIEEKYPHDHQRRKKDAADSKRITDFNRASEALMIERTADLAPIFKTLNAKKRALKEKHAKEISELGFRSSDTPTPNPLIIE